jgi:hypothetical protein
MARFKIRMKLQGLELEVEGTRDDVPLIAQSVGQQLAGLLEPAAQIVEGEARADGNGGAPIAPSAVESSKKGWRARKPRHPAVPASSGDSEASVIWKHDPAKWGNPQQSWSGPHKAVWLLYVASQEGQSKEMSSGTITATFNKMFREAGQLHRRNMARDLGRLKTQSPPLLGEDATKSPSLWFLTHEGNKRAEELVQEARGGTPDSS